MEAIKTALAELVAAEARVHELVDPSIIDERTRNLAKANAAGILALSDAMRAHIIATDIPAMDLKVEPPAPLAVTVTPGSGFVDPPPVADILPDPKIAGTLPGSTEA